MLLYQIAAVTFNRFCMANVVVLLVLVAARFGPQVAKSEKVEGEPPDASRTFAPRWYALPDAPRQLLAITSERWDARPHAERGDEGGRNGRRRKARVREEGLGSADCYAGNAGA